MIKYVVLLLLAGLAEAQTKPAKRRRRRQRSGAGADAEAAAPDDPPDTVVHVREPHTPADDVRAIKGSTRLEAKKQRRREGRESGRRRPPVVTESGRKISSSAIRPPKSVAMALSRRRLEKL